MRTLVLIQLFITGPPLLEQYRPPPQPPLALMEGASARRVGSEAVGSKGRACGGRRGEGEAQQLQGTQTKAQQKLPD